MSMPLRCDFAWPASPTFGDREHLCDLDPGHDGDHECGWCIVCDVCEYTATHSAEPTPVRCDYCGDPLPAVRSRAHIPTTPDLQRRGFAADKVVCPECAAKPKPEGRES